jgi:GGDEF domain-containing protein
MRYFKKDVCGCNGTLVHVNGSSKTRNELITLAYTDSMTGCYNRNALEEYRNFYDHMGLYVGIVDIDGLKTINDIKGHAAGDILIQNVANNLKELDAVVIRLGGDEFLVLSVDNVLFSVKYASFGVQYKPKNMTLRRAMEIADSTMYYDKKKKR